jgi:hypothetical protein
MTFQAVAGILSLPYRRGNCVRQFVANFARMLPLAESRRQFITRLEIVAIDGGWNHLRLRYACVGGGIRL